MSDVTFDRDHRWDGGRWAMTFRAEYAGRVILCLISGEALRDWFDARPDQQGREEAFLRNRVAIEQKARESILKGDLDPSGKVLLVTRHFSAGATSAAAVLAG